MKITYDKQVDAIYIGLTNLKPEGVIEVADGINIDGLVKSLLSLSFRPARHRLRHRRGGRGEMTDSRNLTFYEFIKDEVP